MLLFPTVPCVDSMQCVIVVFPDHTLLPFLYWFHNGYFASSFHNRIFLLCDVKPLQYNHAGLIVTMHLRILWTGTERGSQVSNAMGHGAN